MLEEWAYSLVGGLYGNLVSFGALMKNLFPTATHVNQRFVTPPSETSQNATISDGVPFCLVYGHDMEQKESKSTGPKYHGDEQSQRHGRLEKRVLLKKRLGCESRSRSRSPVTKQTDEDPLHLYVVPGAHSMEDVLDDPHVYQLNFPYHHEYFEPHKPDLCLINWSPPLKDSRSSAAVAKIICKISSYRKYLGVRFEKTIEYSTGQLVQTCLAALAFEQTAIYGLLVMVDGLKWIKVANEGQGGYCVEETDFIFWNQTNDLLSLLQMIEDVV